MNHFDDIEASSQTHQSVALGSRLSETFRDAYWQRVTEVLRLVFNGDEKEADAARRRLEGFRGEQWQQTETLFYHADPFEVAADLAGAREREITPEQKALYLDMQREAERPPASHVTAMHPEDA